MMGETAKTNVFKVETKKVYTAETLIRLMDRPACWKEPVCIEKLVRWRMLRPRTRRRDPMKTRTPPAATAVKSREATTRPKRVVHYFLPKKDEASGLTTCSNAWTPSARRGKRAQPPSDENAWTEEIENKFRSILNKITPENWAMLTDSIASLPITTDRCLKKVVELLFQKAINEPHFAPEYAYICAVMNDKDVQSNGQTTTTSFKELVLLSCQDRFDLMHVHGQSLAERIKEINDCKDMDEKGRLQSKYERDEKVHRERSVGNCRFMCELYKAKILPNQMLETCIKYLLLYPKEETIECACNIISHTGKTLNHKVTFEMLNKYTSSAFKTKIPTRIRFMILDTIELKDNDWIPRKCRTAQQKSSYSGMQSNTKIPENKHSEPAPYTSMLSMDNAPPKYDDLAKHGNTRDLNSPLSLPRTRGGVVSHEDSLVSSCLESEIRCANNIQSSNDKITEIGEVEKKFRSVLNRITAENMVPLAKSVVLLPVKTDDCLIKVVEMLFQKAVDEPMFCPQYAHICSTMKNKAAYPNDETRNATFRTVLVDTCERSFGSIVVQSRTMAKRRREMRRCEDQDGARKQLQEEYDRDETVYRKRSVSYCRFMCELLKVNILIPEILDACVAALVKSSNETSLECTCVILKHVGIELNNNGVFEKLRVHASKKRRSARIRCMILDTIDLKNNGWVPRHPFDETTF